MTTFVLMHGGGMGGWTWKFTRELLEAKEEAGAIADFAAFTQGLDKLFAVPDVGAGDDAVQVMTVHKSKGLEFDHVIVPGLGAKPPIVFD